jgi:hypothetical protein
VSDEHAASFPRTVQIAVEYFKVRTHLPACLLFLQFTHPCRKTPTFVAVNLAG